MCVCAHIRVYRGGTVEKRRRESGEEQVYFGLVGFLHGIET
jgi:hypothetical protein